MKAALKDQPRLDFAAPDGVTLVSYDTGRGVAIDAFKDGQLPGVSANLLSNVDAQQLSAADTGAENMPDSESDMAASVNGAAQPGTVGASPAEGAHTSAPAPSGGDIGMGGLY